MDITELAQQIKSNTLQDYYVFTGLEVQIMRQYIQAIAKHKSAEVCTMDSVEDYVNSDNAHKLLGNARICVFYESDIRILQQYENAKNGKLKGKNDICIFVFGKLAKNTKGYNQAKDRIVEFNYLSDEVLLKYLLRDTKLSEAECKKLITVCENDYSRILLEIDKVNRSNKTVHELTADGTIYTPPTDAVFNFVDAVLEYKPKLSYKLLAESYACGEATLVLLYNLYNGAKHTLQVQSLRGRQIKDICASAGLTAFQVKCALKHTDIYSNQDLIFLMRLVQKAESGIKSGKIDEDIAVRYVLSRFWGQ